MSSYQIHCLSNRKKSKLYAMCLKDGNSFLYFLVTEGGVDEAGLRAALSSSPGFGPWEVCKE